MVRSGAGVGLAADSAVLFYKDGVCRPILTATTELTPYLGGLMSQVDLLSSQEQDILLWVAEAQTGLLVLTDRTAFDSANTVIDQLVMRGLLG